MLHDNQVVGPSPLTLFSGDDLDADLGKPDHSRGGGSRSSSRGRGGGGGTPEFGALDGGGIMAAAAAAQLRSRGRRLTMTAKVRQRRALFDFAS